MSEGLPQGWAEASLADLIASDGIFVDGDWVESKDQDPHGDVRLVQLADVGDGLFRDRSDRSLTTAKAVQLRCTFLQPGDILVARMPDPLGRACIYPDVRRPAVTVVDVCVIRPGMTGVDPKWLMWSLNAPRVREQISSYQSGTTRKRISRKNLQRVQVPVPPLAEQHRIVEVLEDHLSRLDAGRRLLHDALVRCRTYRRNWLWATTHDLEAEPVRLDSVAEVRLGRQRSPNNHAGNSMYPYLRAANIGWSGFKLDDVKQMNFPAKEVETYRLEDGDILLSEASGSASEVGKPALWRGEIKDCCFQNTLIRVRPTAVRPEFLLHCLRADAMTGQFIDQSRGVGIHHLGATTLAAWRVPLPDDSIQAKIAAQIVETEPVLAAIEMTIVKQQHRANHLRNALLTGAFTGKLVPQDQADEPATELLKRIKAERDGQPRAPRAREKAATTFPAPPKKTTFVPAGIQEELPL